MLVCGDLPFACQGLHRVTLPRHGIAIDVGAYLWRQHEVATVDPAAIATRLLRELRHAALCVNIERAKSAGWLRRCQRDESAMILVEGQKRRDVYVRNPIALGEAKCFF